MRISVAIASLIALASPARAAVWPISGYTTDNITATYGPRFGEGFHGAIDLQANVGTPVVAARGGTVTRVVSDPNTALGLTVVINNEDVYGHLSQISVQQGDNVAEGAGIARSGNTGTASLGPHLHLQDGGIIVNTDTISPLHYLPYTPIPPTVKGFQMFNAALSGGRFISSGRVRIDGLTEARTRDLNLVVFDVPPTLQGFPMRFDYDSPAMHDGASDSNSPIRLLGGDWDAHEQQAGQPTSVDFLYTYDTRRAPDGLYNLQVCLTNAKGTSTCQPFPWLIDNTPERLTLLDKDGAQIQSGGLSSGRGISISADDDSGGSGDATRAVSGPGRLEVWKGDPSAGGTLLAANSEVFAGQHTYTSADTGLSVLSSLPEGKIFTRAFDQAGNLASATFSVTSDTTPPTIAPQTKASGPIADGGWSNGKDLLISVDDTVLPDGTKAPSVTGPGGLQLWAGAPQTGRLLGSSAEKFPDKHMYAAAEPGLEALDSLPEDRLAIVAVDQAGNVAPDYSVLIDRTLPVFTAKAGDIAISSGSDLGIGPVHIDANDLASEAAEAAGIGASGVTRIRLYRTDSPNFDEQEDFAPGEDAKVDFPLSGDGTVPQGDFLAEVTDRAGNVAKLPFHLHARPPQVEVDLDSDMEVTYEGIDTGEFKTPSNSLVFQFTGDEGLTQIRLFFNGNAVFSKDGDGSQSAVTFSLPQAAKGDYTFSAKDVDGRLVTGKLTAYTYNLAADPEASVASFDSSRGQFAAFLKIKAASDSGGGVGEIDLFKAEGSGPTFTAGARVGGGNFGAEPTAGFFVSDLALGNYVAVSRDPWGNVVQQAISLQQSFGRLTDYFGAGTMNNVTAAAPASPVGGMLSLVPRSSFPTLYQPSGAYESPVFDLHAPHEQSPGTKEAEIFAPVPVIGQALFSPPPLVLGVGGFVDSQGGGHPPDALPYSLTEFGGSDTGVSVTEELATSDDPSGGSFFTAAKVVVRYDAGSDALVLSQAQNPVAPPHTGRYIKERLTLTSNSKPLAPSRADPDVNNTLANALTPVVDALRSSPLFASVLTLQGDRAIWTANSEELIGGLPAFNIKSPVPNLTVSRANLAVAPYSLLVQNVLQKELKPIRSGYIADPVVGLGPAIVTMRLDSSDLAGLDPQTLAIWAAPPGSELTRLSTTFDPDSNILTASMSGFHLDTLFVAFGRPLPGEPAPAAKGLAIAADAHGKLWEVGSDGSDIWLGRYGPGGLEARAQLPGGADDGAWSIRFDGAGNAYAVGSTSSDLAVYAVSPSAVPLSSATFHDVGGAKAVAWDASDDLWITGSLQQGSPADGSLSLKMGLWKYAPATGLLTLTTTYTRGGPADAGFGVRVLDDKVFVEGFTSTSPLSSPSLGLGLWAFDAAGHGPVAGPFIKAGYLSKLDTGVNARLEVSSGTLYAFAPRTGAGGQNDLGFVHYRGDGKTLVERAFSAGQGVDLVAQAVTRDGQGNFAVAVQAEANGNKTFGVARYALDGGFLGTTAATPAQGGVSGIAALGSDLWLAVDGSSVPHRFAGTAPFAGVDLLISSAPMDATPPVSTAAVAAPRFVGAAGDLFVSSRTGVSLTAFDPPEADGSDGSGLDRIEISVDSGPVAVYASTLTFTEGAHALMFRAVDKAGNAEAPHVLALRSDATPPQTALAVSGPKASAEAGGFYASTSTVIAFDGLDPVSSGVASGLASTQWQDNEGEWQVSGSTSLQEGVHALGYRSADNVENAELAKLTSVYVDATPPVTGVLVGSPQAAAADGLVVSARTPIAFSAADPLAAGVASGVDRTLFAVAGGSWTVYAGSFTLAVPDGPTPLSFFSEDRVGNAEASKSTTVVMDAAPPALAFLSPAACDGGICRVVQGRVPVFGSVADVHLSSWTLSSAGVAVASGSVNASGLLGTLDATSVSGAFTLALAAQDAVGNASSASLALWAGEPGRLLVLGARGALNHPEGVAWAGGKLYVADTDDQQVKVYDSSGTFLAAYGKRGRRIEPYFNSPRGVAADAVGNIYVADANHHRVAKLSPDGALLWSVGASEVRNGVRHFRPGTGPGEFQHPSGVALGPDGVYVADTDNRRVQVLDANGAFLRQFALPRAVGANDGDAHGRGHGKSEDHGSSRTAGKPVGIAVDAAGEVFIADVEGRRALKLDGQGQVLLSIPGFTRPEGTAVTPDGRCWLVSDRQRGTVSKFDGAGNPTLEFGRGALEEPVGLGLTGEDVLLVADRGKEQVQGFGVPGPAPIFATGGPAAGREEAAEDEDEVVASTVTRAEGGVVVDSDKAAVRLPPNALPEDEELTVSRVEKADPDAERKQEEAARAGLAAVAPAVEFGPEGLQFAAPVTISLPYDPQQLASPGISEQSLQVNYWNPKTKAWEPLLSHVDPAQHVVVAQTRHFSQYQVLAPAGALAPQATASSTVDTVQVACNPLRHDCRPMAFRNLPAGARLRLYTLAGSLVKDFSADGSGTATWDGANQDGQPVASGVYFLYAQGAGGKKLIRVAVER